MHVNISEWDNLNRDVMVRLLEKTNTGFTYIYDRFTPDVPVSKGMYFSFLALGYMN